MPLGPYFTVVGAVLTTLLFLTDAKLEKRGPLWFSNDFTGLPKPWRAQTQKVVANPVPLRDARSEIINHPNRAHAVALRQ
jgi:hypothetical protein